MDAATLAERLARLPRTKLTSGPTPLEPAHRLGRAIGLPNLYVKRDDLTSVAFGGNKVRQMEFVLGDARAAGADLLIAGGSFDQSNHARVAAGAARAAGLRSLIVVRPGGQHPGPQGNGLLTRLLADRFVIADELADAPSDRLAEVAFRARIFERLADEERERGARPYVLTGSSTAIGALGYVAASLELAEQLRSMGLQRPVVAVTSTGATQAGLELGSRLLGGAFRVIGLAYSPTGGQGSRWVAELATGAARILDSDVTVAPEGVRNDDRGAGASYGALDDARRDIIELAISSEGLLLDPVYTATGLAGLRSLAAAGAIEADEDVIFIHTGGLPALFSYAGDLAPAAPR